MDKPLIRNGMGVPLHRLLGDSAFEPLHIEAMVFAFEAVCLELRLAQRPNDPLREMVALKVIEFAQRGEREPQRLRDLALAALRD